MEAVLAVLGAGPMGYFARTRRRGLELYLAAWAVVFPIQTLVVYLTSADMALVYFAFNVPILAVGIGLNHLGSALGERRRNEPAIGAGAA